MSLQLAFHVLSGVAGAPGRSALAEAPESLITQASIKFALEVMQWQGGPDAALSVWVTKEQEV
jgi:hypothetical protein